MKIVNICIISKNSLENAIIENALKDHAPLFRIVSIITNNENIEEKIKFEKPDIVFIDFSFENMQVKNILIFLTKNNIDVILLIKTNADAIQAFKTNSLSCIIKPITHKKVAVTINKIYKKTIQQFYI